MSDMSFHGPIKGRNAVVGNSVSEGGTLNVVIHQSLESDEDKKCLKDLRTTDPRDEKTRIQETKGGLLRDSYYWILDHNDFQRWLGDPQCRLLWVKGDPGKGKTMLLCGIIDEMELKWHRLSYFFCQATVAELRNATAVLRGLIYSLVIQQPSLISHVREKYDQAGKQVFEGRNAWTTLSKMLEKMLKDPGLGNAVLIIDALDECVEDLPRLLDFIDQASSCCPAKWIVSSRNWPSIEERLDNAAQNVRICLELNEDSISAAVRAYIRFKVQYLAQRKNYDEETREYVEQYLFSNANDTFLWVALVCEELADSKVRKWHTRTKLKSFPPGLDPLYQRMMEDICNSYDADICKQILAIISVVYRPITLVELRCLVELPEIDENDMAVLIASCGSLLTLREGVIYFVHQSVKDFLMGKQLNMVFPSGIGGVHRTIFSRSLIVVSETLRRDVYNLHNPGVHIDKVGTPNPDPLATVAYSCVYWAHHLNDSNSFNRGTIEEALQDNGNTHIFLKEKFINWLEALGLLRCLPKGVIAIQNLRNLIGREESPQLMDLVQDASRFILSHKGVIEVTPLQVYVSALLFSPTNSLVRRLFEKQELKWVILKPTMEADWNACLQTLEHRGPVFSVVFSVDGQWLASVSDKKVKIWDAATGSCVQTSEYDDDNGVVTVAFSADGPRLASGSEDTVKIWNIATGVCLQTVKHGYKATSIAFSADSQRLALGSSDGTVVVWNTATCSCLHTLKHDRRVTAIAFSADSQWLASGSLEGIVKIWDIAIGGYLQTFKGHRNWVKAVTFSADSQWLASGSTDSTVKIWNTATGDCLHTLKHDREVTSIAFSADSQWLASGSYDKTVKIWDRAIGSCLQTFEGHGFLVLSVAFSADSQWLASGSYDKTVKIWDRATGDCLQTFKGHRDWVKTVTFSADSQWLASGSAYTINIWDTVIGSCVQTLDIDARIDRLSFDPMANTRLYTNLGVLDLNLESFIGTVSLQHTSFHGYSINRNCTWILKDGKPVVRLPPDYEGSKSAVAGSMVAVGSKSGRVFVMKFSEQGPDL